MLRETRRNEKAEEKGGKGPVHAADCSSSAA
jgi:hypothetical protein